jgi:transketolase N-terminal domain/subunit
MKKIIKHIKIRKKINIKIIKRQHHLSDNKFNPINLNKENLKMIFKYKNSIHPNSKLSKIKIMLCLIALKWNFFKNNHKYNNNKNMEIMSKFSKSKTMNN